MGGRTGREEGQDSSRSPEGQEAPGGQVCCRVSSPGWVGGVSSPGWVGLSWRRRRGWGLASAAGSGAPRGSAGPGAGRGGSF